MKNSYIFLLVSIVIALNTVRADEILWSYDLTELPYMWTWSHCSFSSLGALIHIMDVGYPEDGRSMSGFLQTEFVIGSSNFDSLVIHTSQHTYLAAGNLGTASVALELQVNGVPVELWERNIYAVSGWTTYSDSDPIHVVMTGFSNGDLLRFRFDASAHAGYYSEAIVEWRLWDASLTAYGNLPLEQSTWTGIKAAMGCQLQ